MASSRLAIWRFENYSAARILPAPNDFVHQKYDTQTTPKSYPRGVQFYRVYYWCIIFFWAPPRGGTGFSLGYTLSPYTHYLSQHYFTTFFTRKFLLIALGGNGYALGSLSSSQSGVKWMLARLSAQRTCASERARGEVESQRDSRNEWSYCLCLRKPRCQRLRRHLAWSFPLSAHPSSMGSSRFHFQQPELNEVLLPG